MGRPRKFDQETLLAQATSVFWLKGYDATTTEDIEAATGLKRGSLYNAFGDKHGLYMAALEYYARVEMVAAIDAVKTAPSFRAGVRAFLDRVTEQVEAAPEKRGCLLCDAATEMSHRHSDVALVVTDAYDALRDALSEKAKTQASKPNNVDAQSIADHIVSVYIGLRTLSKLGYSTEVLARAVSSTVASL